MFQSQTVSGQRQRIRLRFFLHQVGPVISYIVYKFLDSIIVFLSAPYFRILVGGLIAPENDDDDDSPATFRFFVAELVAVVVAGDAEP
jgi:hypothetical protein